MSSPLKQNTTALQELLDKINQLPEAGIIPSGTLSITENGTHDVTTYENVDVAVPVGVFPSGTLSVTENGTYDVTEYASVEIDVEGSSLAPNARVYYVGKAQISIQQVLDVSVS